MRKGPCQGAWLVSTFLSIGSWSAQDRELFHAQLDFVPRHDCPLGLQRGLSEHLYCVLVTLLGILLLRSSPPATSEICESAFSTRRLSVGGPPHLAFLFWDLECLSGKCRRGLVPC